MTTSLRNVTLRDTAGSAWMMVAAVLLIGIGGMANHLDAATAVIIIAGIAVVFAVLDPSTALLRQLTPRSVTTIVAVGVLLETVTLPMRPMLTSPLYSVGLIGLAVLGLHAMFARGTQRIIEMTLIAIAYSALMMWMVSSKPLPDIDVYVIQQEGVQALLRGENPFDLTFPIQVELPHPHYSPDVVTDGALNFGFIYPPLSLLMAIPGYVLGGDYRYGAVAALSIAAVVIAAIRPGPAAAGAALLVLFAPMTQQVLYFGWTDPFVILLMAMTVLFMVRRSAAAPFAVGLLAASKQYMLLALILAPALLRRVASGVDTRRHLVTPLLVVIATFAPFVLWNAAAIVYSTVTVHLLQPFREDSLSIPALLVRAGFAEASAMLGFVFAAAALGLVLLRAPRTPAGFCAGGAVILFAFFVFGKQAFLHYYFLVVGLLACGVAAIDFGSISATGDQPSARRG